MIEPDTFLELPFGTCEWTEYIREVADCEVAKDKKFIPLKYSGHFAQFAMDPMAQREQGVYVVIFAKWGYGRPAAS
ncbi:MAG TPA: hypothetical protein VFE46_02165 [Pirellulales bacterium]|jgi:hypothetical protein|nr:hypothetical protein [Pirellulales bacterium]